MFHLGNMFKNVCSEVKAKLYFQVYVLYKVLYMQYIKP